MGDPLVIRSCSQAQEWDTFVGTVPWATPQHAFAWGRALETCFGYLRQTYKLFVLRDRIVAALPFIRLSGGGPFRSLHSLVFDSYGGPLIHSDCLADDDLSRAISAAIDSEATRWRAFEAKLVAPPGAPEAVVQCLRRDDAVTCLRRDCHVLSLDRPMDSVVAGYAPSVRRAVRRSAREGVLVQEDPDLAEVRAAYPIYRRTMSRLGATSKPWRFIEALLRDKLAVAFLARRDARPIALVVLLVSPRMASYWISAADPAASACRPTNALVDHAIRWCHARGIRRLSFGESQPDRPGLVRFKEGWGAETTCSTTVLRVYRPRVRQAWSALEPTVRRGYAVWDRLRHGAT
ncbi:MAG: GNAT family N-acetyltransferase [bacterium]